MGYGFIGIGGVVGFYDVPVTAAAYLLFGEIFNQVRLYHDTACKSMMLQTWRQRKRVPQEKSMGTPRTDLAPVVQKRSRAHQ